MVNSGKLGRCMVEIEDSLQRSYMVKFLSPITLHTATFEEAYLLADLATTAID